MAVLTKRLVPDFRRLRICRTHLTEIRHQYTHMTRFRHLDAHLAGIRHQGVCTRAAEKNPQPRTYARAESSGVMVMDWKRCCM